MSPPSWQSGTSTHRARLLNEGIVNESDEAHSASQVKSKVTKSTATAKEELSSDIQQRRIMKCSRRPQQKQ